MPMKTDRLKLPLPLGNENVTRESINAIFEKIDAGVATQEELDKAVSEMDIPDASLTQKGKVQLSSKTNGTSETLAATEKAVNVAFAEAQSAKQLGVEQKANVVAALNSIGVAASTSESWAQLITKMASVIRATGNATVGQVLAGATFSNASANGLIGAIPNRSAQSAHQLAKLTEVWAGDRAFMMPPDGYYDGQSWVYALTPDLQPANILAGKNILGVAGTAAPGIAPGETPLFSFVGKNILKWPPADTWVSYYRITFAFAGRYRISYTTNPGGGIESHRYRCNIFSGGVPIGTERVTSSFQGDITYTEDLDISAGQVIEFRSSCNYASRPFEMKDIYVRSAIGFVGVEL
ncbi:phage tail protein [Paenibacillus sp. FSL W8-0426]|uniref:phage tail protein n=1 Tax=Paenibacillus sp. FSL W8-0426 TaxID=2921714 RepID=UPI0030DA8C94